MYECVICLSLNHPSRLHCQNCGTIPACYSILKKPIKSFTTYSDFAIIESVIATGAERASQKRISRVGLRTVELTKYASEGE